MTTEALLTILVAGVGTLAARESFLLVAHRATDLSEGVLRVLRMIPPAALAALVAPPLFRPGGVLDLWHPALPAGVVTALVAWRFRSVGVALLIGLALAWLLESL